MAAAGLAWLAGIGLQMQQPALWPAAHYLALGLAALQQRAGAPASGWRRCCRPSWKAWTCNSPV